MKLILVISLFCLALQADCRVREDEDLEMELEKELDLENNMKKEVLLSAGKPTTQSSTVHGGDSSRAVDGNTNQHYFNGKSCTHTLPQHRSWWQVDLQGTFLVKKLVIYNRKDCCGDRLNNIEVRVIADGGKTWEVCATYGQGGHNGQVLTLNCKNPIEGRYVAIFHTNTQTLTLCEVQVYGDYSSDMQLLSTGKPTTQSSTVHGGDSSRAVDGNTNQHYFNGKTCTHTLPQLKAWWQVDLQGTYLVKKVVIYNRQDCCGDRLNNIEVKVIADGGKTFDTCATYGQGGHNGQVLTLHCTKPLVGRYVAIFHTDKQILTLCEVQVFGEPYKKPDCLGPKVNGDYGYKGTKGVTKTGAKCQRWDATSPVSPSSSVRNMDPKELKSMEDYCRQPSVDLDARPWCYSKDAPNGRWDYCDIPDCP